MLPRSQRLTDADGFTTAVRLGRRVSGRTLVLHAQLDAAPQDDPSLVRVGFVVSKAVGPAVTRNRVKRRLRHQARELLSSLSTEGETRLPGSAVLVVRALPAAASATSEELRADLARCLHRVMS
ncbi:ribonuclease P protein component [Nocardioides sp. Kera G14]|nr:ribonuclease P protein component [Nocardioides sp. Kera G14]UDY23583.1 ribonuclease P protein component [Nocardioides sp. Kera G14]